MPTLKKHTINNKRKVTQGAGPSEKVEELWYRCSALVISCSGLLRTQRSFRCL